MAIFMNFYAQIAPNVYRVNLEALITVHVFRISAVKNLTLQLVAGVNTNQEPQFEVDFQGLRFEVVVEVPLVATFCVWPLLVTGNSIIAGLCSVARCIVKGGEAAKHLLGFREACLAACSESSIWTKFCEVDMVAAVKKLLRNPDDCLQEGAFVIPEDFARFEYHMGEPVRLHNVYKVARVKNSDKDLKSGVPLDALNLPHSYGEGCFMTLADVILFPCFDVVFRAVGSLEVLEAHLPLTMRWFRNMGAQNLPELQYTFMSSRQPLRYSRIIPTADIRKESLYTSDPKRYKPQSRIYTKQLDIETSLRKLEASPTTNAGIPYGHEIDFDWSDVPLEASPRSGALPVKRAARKCQQLESLAKSVLKLKATRDIKTVVDFCSGSGHLGILLAALLPDCEFLLVENKERSLQRARDRISNLTLSNVLLLQCNLDYFKAPFDLGVSLHACGVATDLVIQSCVANRAHFVSCPCCYGGIKDCLAYPRSEDFRKLVTYKEYLSLAHGADQTHDDSNTKTRQGFLCMDVVDTDRKLYAELHGYEVHLGKLQPPSCTPKNNLLVGVYLGG